ncbi:MAG: glycosyltransferase [Deltaproteobacteria bacterium]|nr:glycosyltransferase [Deltaproteobacteria bacterium]
MKVITIITHQVRGGIFKRLSILVEALLENGYEVHYLSAQPLALKKHEKLVPHVVHLPVKLFEGVWFWLCVSIVFPIALLRILIAEKFTAVLVFSAFYSLLAKLGCFFSRTPIVLFLRSVPWELRSITYRSVFLRGLGNLVDFFGVLSARKVVVVSELIRKRLIDEPFIKAERVVTLPNAIVYPKALIENSRKNASSSKPISKTNNVDTFGKNGDLADIGVSAREAFEQQISPGPVKRDARAASGYSVWQERVDDKSWKLWLGGFSNRKRELARRCHLPEKSIFLAVSGELNVQKNIDYIIRVLGATASEKPVLIICGDGDQKPKILAIAAGYGQLDRIILTGWLEDPIDIIAGCDVFIVTSRYEGTSNAMLEALGAGVPILAPDTPEMREILIYDELLYDAKHVGNFAELLDSIAGRKYKLERIKELSHERAKALSFQWGDKVIDLIEKELS